ncbi:hypothetical protein [Micromonospora sp. DT233]|uniref:hypothetical protein n=1 Tax=Micromonospora sp. DT233 TaxID=3393432 RepID=UPI003CEFB9D7
MGRHRRTYDDAPPQPATAGVAYWSVADAGWPAVRPNLPAELADLLAPPIVVGVARATVAARPDAAHFHQLDGARGPLRGGTARR